ncbi:MAG: hypothetical protein AB2A00_28900 [Myxococcota bacterium]
MPTYNFADTTVSAALSHAVNGIPDDDLKFKVDILVAKTARGLAAARSINFTDYENRELSEHDLTLWNELAPHMAAIFKELNSLVDTALDLFQKEEPDGDAEKQLGKDFDQAFDLLTEGEAHPVTGEAAKERTPLQVVTDLVHSYAWVLKKDIQGEARKLREPSLMQAQWNLMGELEEFRDRIVGIMHAMVAAVLGVFGEVEVEALYPQANEWVEMGVAVRRNIADLVTEVESHVNVLKGRPSDDTVRAILTEDDERTARLLKLPAIKSLHVADRHQLQEFRREAAKLRASPELNVMKAREVMDGFGTFLASVQTVELRERLKAHDVEVAQEAKGALERAAAVVEENPAQAMLLLAHAGRRVARLYGVSPALDAAARQLRDMAGQAVNVSTLRNVITALAGAVAPIAAQQ